MASERENAVAERASLTLLVTPGAQAVIEDFPPVTTMGVCWEETAGPLRHATRPTEWGEIPGRIEDYPLVTTMGIAWQGPDGPGWRLEPVTPPGWVELGAVWTPTELPNLVAWYDAQDASSITLNGLNVSQWKDKSGNGHNAVQGTASSQPTYNATGFNGKPTLSFDGVNDGLQATIPAGTFPAEFALSLVSNESDICARTDTGNQGIYFPWPPPGADQIYVNGGQNSMPTAFPTGSLMVFDLDYSDVGKAVNSWQNGNPYWINSVMTFTWGDTVGDFGIGSFYTSYVPGIVSEIVLCSAIVAADRQKLEGYMAWRWGLEGNLPAGHPYKSAPP